MECHLVNLNEATARRDAVEANFRAISPGGWELVRYPAIGAAIASRHPGELSDGAKGCFLSHRTLIASNLADEETIFIAEDDVVFAPQCFAVIEDVLRRYRDWDIIFTEIMLANVGDMVLVAKTRPAMVRDGAFKLITLNRSKFFSSTAYLVNGRSKAKVAKLLGGIASLDTPYDLTLQNLAHSGQINAFAIFPFVTSISGAASQSQIQPDKFASADFILNAFRRLMYVDRDLERCRQTSDFISNELADEESRLVGTIFAGVVSPQFPMKR